MYTAQLLLEDGLPHVASSVGSDSGCYSSYATSSNQTSFHSFPAVDSEVDVNITCRRRLSSNADTPDYGSLCSLQRRWLATVENSLSPNDLRWIPFNNLYFTSLSVFSVLQAFLIQLVFLYIL